MRTLVAALTGVLILVAAPAAQILDRHVVVHNAADEPIFFLYITNVASSAWVEDVLGDDVIPPGEDVRINVDDGSGYCVYDFEVTFESGRQASEYDVNVCETRRLSFR